MKIAYFTDMFLPQANGVGTSLANQARELGKEGHKVLIFTPDFSNIRREKFRAENVTVVHLPAVPSLIYTEFKFVVPGLGLPKVVRLLMKFKPDIIHLHSTFTIGMDAVMAARIFKKPLVGTIHIYFTNTDYLRFVKYKLAVKVLDKTVRGYINFLFNQCDLLLTPSTTLISELKKKGFEKTVHYLPNGVTLKEPDILTEKKRADFKKKYNLGQKVVLHFGRLSYEKNVDVLIKSFSLLTKKHDDVSLLLIGDGPSTKNLKGLVKKLGLEEKVVFTGFIDHRILLSSGILSLGDVFATASNMEVNPMVVLEAMLYGLPIVGVKQAGLIELISSNGFLVKPGSSRELMKAVEKILYDQSLASAMRGESLKLIKEYSIDKTTAKLLHYYGSLKSSKK